MTDTTPLTGEQLRGIRYRGGRPSQYTAATTRRDYADMLGEILRLRGVLGQTEDQLEHSRKESAELRDYVSKLIKRIGEAK